MIIGLSGKIGSGKDTVANILERKGYKHVKISNYLYKIVHKITNMDITSLKSRKGKDSIAHPFDITVRELLQEVGTKMRDIDEDFWLKLCFHNLKNDNIVISDVRFKNEAEYIKNKNGVIIRLIGNPTGLKQSDHISETALDNYEFKYIINNNKDIKNLSVKLNNIINNIYLK